MQALWVQIKNRIIGIDMIGQEQIISCRKKGKSPSCVFIEFDEEPKKPRYDWQHPEKQIDYRFNPVVYVKKDELPDMRFLVGLGVICESQSWSDEYLSFIDRLIKYKPRYIVASAIRENGSILEWRGEDWNAYSE